MKVLALFNKEAGMKEKIKKIIHILLRESEPPEMVVAGIFNEEEDFLKAVKGMKGFQGLSAVTPYPVHGLEELLKIKRSWIPWVTFVFGLLGMGAGFLLTWWTSAVSWPLIIGGKPFFSFPAFVPVIFECTILFSALMSVGALFYACGLPKVNPPVLDKNLTSHKFAVYCPVSGNNKEKAAQRLKELSADKVITADF